MIMKKWIYKTPAPELVGELAQHLDISRASAAVLANRGIGSVEEAREFMHPKLSNLHSPFLLPDIEKAVLRLRRAIEEKEKVLIYGDRDVDGVTSLCILVRTLTTLGLEPLWYIPSTEGYGLNKDVIERYRQEGVTLIVTVDCGITSLTEALQIQECAIDLIVTDHHETSPDGLPVAAAVVDPKREDSRYPFYDLAGCAVSFKVAEALMLSYGKYFGKTLNSIALTSAHNQGDAAAVSVIKARNAVIEDTRVFLADTEKDRAELAAFIADEYLVVAERGVITALRDKGIGLANPVIDMNDWVRCNTSLASAPSAHPLDPQGLPLQGAAAVYARFKELEYTDDIRMQFFRNDNIDLVALGTIADIMPLHGENRILVTAGLVSLGQSKKPGIQALLERAARAGSGALKAKAISWNVTPLLNAAGRRGKADLSVRLLLSRDSYAAHEILDGIMKLNDQRKELQAENLDAFLSFVPEQCDVENDKILVVTAEGLEHGVTGIVASHIVRKYNRPVVLLIIEGDEAVGAVRSIDGFDIVQVLNRMKDLFVKYGGHAKAAGFTLKKERIEEFRSRIKAVAQHEIDDASLLPVIEIDAELQASEVSPRLLQELEGIEPFGNGNPYPLFGLKNMQVVAHELLGAKSNHLKLRVSKNGSRALEAVGWGFGPRSAEIAALRAIDMAVHVEYNEWNKNKTLQLMLVDVKPSEEI